MSEVMDRLMEAKTALDNELRLRRKEMATIGGLDDCNRLWYASQLVVAAMDTIQHVRDVPPPRYLEDYYRKPSEAKKG